VWGETVIGSDKHACVSDGFVLQLFKHPDALSEMPRQSAPSRIPPNSECSEERNAEKANVASELEHYPAEVLEAVLGILRARSQAERAKA